MKYQGSALSEMATPDYIYGTDVCSCGSSEVRNASPYQVANVSACTLLDFTCQMCIGFRRIACAQIMYICVSESNLSHLYLL